MEKDPSMKSQEYMPYCSSAGKSSGPVKCFFDGHTERTWLGRSQAMNQMNPRGVISQERAAAMGGKLILLAAPRTTVRLKTIEGAR